MSFNPIGFLISKWNFKLQAFSNLSINSWINLLLDTNNSLFLSTSTRIELFVFVANLYDLIWLNMNRVIHGSTSFSVQDLVIKATKSADGH